MREREQPGYRERPMNSTTRGLVVALVVLVGVALAFSVLMGGMMGPGMMGPGIMPRGNGPWGWTWGLGMGVGGLAMLAFLGGPDRRRPADRTNPGRWPGTPVARLAARHPQAALCGW